MAIIKKDREGSMYLQIYIMLYQDLTVANAG
jgi:hypothetical protein